MTAIRFCWFRSAVTLVAGLILLASQLFCTAVDALPVFHHQGIVLDYRGLKYNPCDDIIIPSVIKAYQHLQKPLGRYYMYYAPHNPPGGICLAYADALEGP